MGEHPKLEDGIVRWLDGSCRPASDLEAELFAEIATLTRDLEQARLERDEMRRGIRSGFLDRAEAAEARLSALTQAIRDLEQRWREIGRDLSRDLEPVIQAAGDQTTNCADELQQLRQLKGERK